MATIRAFTDAVARLGAAPAQAVALARPCSWMIGRPVVGAVVPRNNVRSATFLPTAVGAMRSGVISGSTRTSNPDAPVSRTVRLYSENTGAFVQEVQSSAGGVYAFTGLDPDAKYFVVAFDLPGGYRAVVADDQTPEVAA
jgi:hypothetical protein